MKKSFLSIGFLFVVLISQAQISKGKDFWFGFMANYFQQTGELRVYVTSEAPCSGMISSPLQGWSQTFTVTPGVSTLILVPYNIGENFNSDIISTQALHVTTTECVSVFAHYYQGASSDAAVIFPTNSVGRDYVVTSWYDANINNGSPEFLIAATEDATTIDITPSTTAGSHAAGVTYSISIDSGEVYQLQSGNGDLTGTIVRGTNNKNFALFGGHVCANIIGCSYCDHLFDQLYPTPSWGTEFVTVPYFGRDYDVFRVLASQNGTQFSINGGAPISLNAGQFNQFSLSAVSYISSNVPVSVMQYSTGTDCDVSNPDAIGDPFMIALSPITQSINKVTFNAFANTLPSFTYYTNIIAKTTDLATVMFDGVSIGGTFTPVPQNPTYSYVIRTITQGDHTITANQGIIAYVYGYGDYESYGYSAGVRVQVPFLSVYDTTRAYCPLDTVYLNLNTPDTARLIYTEWDLGDGSPHLFDTLHFWHVYQNYGSYPITLIYELKSACKKDTMVIDTVKILGPEPDFGGPYQYCVPQNVSLSIRAKVTPDTLFFKMGPNSWFTTDTNYVLNFYADRDTVVYVRVSSNICDGFDTAYIYVASDTAGFTFSNACAGTPVDFLNTSHYAVGLTYSWLWDFGDGTTSVAVSPSHQYAAGGTYNVKLRLTSPAPAFCTDSIVQAVTIYDKPNAAFIANYVCNDSVLTPTNSSTVASGVLSYDWDFGDGSLHTTTQSPSHEYAQSGAYNVTLIASVAGGACSDTATIYNNIIIGAVQEFSGINMCLGAATQFNDLTINSSGSAILSYNWDFDDANTSTQQSPSHTYTADGSYIVTLVLDYGSNCFDSVKHTVAVNPLPVVNFTIADICNSGLALPVNTSTINSGNMNYTWNFGDNSAIVNGLNPSHTYPFSGNYNIQLIALSDSACADTAVTTIQVIRGTIIDFVASTVCESNTTSFTDQTANPYNTTINGYTWSFGDASFANQQNATHLYGSFGVYNVQLRLDYGNNCADSLTKQVTVYEVPVAGFTVADVCNDSIVSPQNTSSISSGALSYTWTFGDGSNVVTGQNPAHTYQQSGTYSIQVLAESSAGCADSITRPVIVTIGTAIDFIAPAVCEGITTSFTDQTANPYNTSINGYTWSFGDANFSNQQNTTHVYGTFGVYSVQLRLDYGNNCADSLTKQVTVNEIPAAAFSVADVCNDSIVTPQSTSSISSGVLSYAWTFGDGSNAVNGQATSHTYQQSGTYSIQVLAESSAGCADSITHPVIVTIGTTIDFVAPAVCEGITTSFTDQTSNPYNTTINGYTWSFGDANFSNQQNTTHVYGTFGVYNVQLRLDYGNNCTDSLTKQVTVNEIPVAGFTVADVCNDSVVSPQNTSSISSGALSYAWTFGDGSNVVTGQNPAHTYQQSGTYSIQVLAESSTGCADSITHPVIVTIGTAIDFVAPAVCEGVTTNFTDQTTNPYNTTINGYTWSFGDASFANQQNTTHVYGSFGVYNVQLRLDYGNNCLDSLTKQVTVNEIPVAAFTVADVCNDSVVSPQNTSSISNGTLSYAWTFGDGSNAVNGPATSYTYHQSGTYSIQVLAESSAGCADSITHPVIVTIGTTIDFTTPPLCEGSISLFTNAISNPYNTTVNTYNWSFGDGSISTQQSPMHTYSVYGNYTVQLKLEYDNSCADSITRQITIHQKPVADFNSTTPCIGRSMQLNDLSSPASEVNAWNWDLGDGSLATSQNGLHVYAIAGNHSAQLIVTTSNGCKDTVLKSVTVLGVTNAQFSALSVCYPAASQFINSTDLVTYPVSNFVWTFGDGSADNSQAAPAHAYPAAGVYNVTLVANFANGCADTSSQAVEVYVVPTVSAVITDVSCFGGSDGSIQLSPVLGQQSFVYSWSNALSSAAVSSLPAGTYNVTFTDAYTCSSTGSYSIAEPTQLLIDTTVTQITCFGYSDGVIQVIATQGTPSYNFAWSNGNQTSLASQLLAGIYSVTVTDAKGCSVSSSVTLTDPLPYTLLLDSLTTMDLGATIQLSANAINGNPVSWSWSPDEFLSCASCQSTEANPVNDMIYNVVSVDDKGCIAKAETRLYVVPVYNVFVPNIFTPNGDGANDFFEVFGNKEAWKQFEVNVFDRWGEKVFEANDMNFKWDGMFKGRLLNPQVLIYTVKVIYLNNFSDKLFKGSLTLVR